MNKLSTLKIIALTLILSACTVPNVNMTNSRVSTFNQTFSLENNQQIAQNEALKWSSEARLSGAYYLVLNQVPFLSYEYVSSSKSEQQLAVKIEQNGSITSKVTKTHLLNQAFPNPDWLTSSNQALNLARKKGFYTQDNFGVGLSYWKGMGIPKESLKWSVLSFGDPNITTFYVVDDHTKAIWQCQDATATTGCLPTETIKKSYLNHF